MSPSAPFAVVTTPRGIRHALVPATNVEAWSTDRAFDTLMTAMRNDEFAARQLAGLARDRGCLDHTPEAVARWLAQEVGRGLLIPVAHREPSTARGRPVLGHEGFLPDDWSELTPLSALREREPTVEFGWLGIELVDHDGVPFAGYELTLVHCDGRRDRVVLDDAGRHRARAVALPGPTLVGFPKQVLLPDSARDKQALDGFARRPDDVPVAREPKAALFLKQLDRSYRLVLDTPASVSPPVVSVDPVVLRRVELGAIGFHPGGVLTLPRPGAGRWHPWAALTILARDLQRTPGAGFVALGHEDREDPAQHSWLRVHALVSFIFDDRSSWLAVAAKWGRVRDTQEFLGYLHHVRRWGVPIVAVTDDADTPTHDAVVAFQRIYNEAFAPTEAIEEDGVIGLQTLGAIYDVARADLFEWLAAAGTEINALVPHDHAACALACGQQFKPCPTLVVGGPGQPAGRFVDLVVIPPDAAHRVDLHKAPPGAGVYDVDRIDVLPLDGAVPPSTGLLRIQLMDPWGRALGNIAYRLEVGEDRRDGFTSTTGHVNEDGVARGVPLLRTSLGRVMFHDLYRAEAPASDQTAAAAPATEEDEDWTFADDEDDAGGPGAGAAIADESRIPADVRHADQTAADEPGDEDRQWHAEGDDGEGDDLDDPDGELDDDGDDVVILDEDDELDDLELDPDAPTDPEVPDAPPALIGDASIDVYCTDPVCPLHATAPGTPLQHLLRDGLNVPDVPELVDEPVGCPLCHVAEPARDGRLVYTHREPASVVPAEWDFVSGAWQRVRRVASALLPKPGSSAATLDHAKAKTSDVAVGVVLPMLPYGGHVLRHGNTDAGARYGEDSSDPAALLDPPKPRYVLELQHDLALLGYLDGRPATVDGAKPGDFDDYIVGAVLALKHDFSRFYGVPTTTSVSETEVDGAAGVALADFNNPMYFDGGLYHDAFVYLWAFARDDATVTNGGKLVAGTKAIKRATPNWIRRVMKKYRDGRKRPLAQLSIMAKPVETLRAALRLVDLEKYRGPRVTRPHDEVFAHASLAPARPGKKSNNLEHWIQWTGTLELLSTVDEIVAVVSDELAALDVRADLSEQEAAQLAAFRTAVGELSELATGFARGFRDIVGGLPEATDAYFAKLRACARVDNATACYIKAALRYVLVGRGGATRRMHGTLAFRFPDAGAPDGATANSNREIVESILDLNRAGARVPPAIVLERFIGESGLKQHATPLKRYALSPGEGKIRQPLMGLDWNNRGGSNFVFNPFWTRGPGESKCLAMSRGWGIGQYTLPTLLPGVTPRGRKNHAQGFNWIHGLPLSPDNATVSLPVAIATLAGGVTAGTDLLRRKFRENSLQRDCTYDKVGGQRYNCRDCLARFPKPRDSFLPYTAPGSKSIRTYYLLQTYDPTDEAASTAFAALVGEAPTSADASARREFPCSWLTAVMRYAGTGDRAISRLYKLTRNIATSSAGSGEKKRLFAEYLEKFATEGSGL